MAFRTERNEAAEAEVANRVIVVEAPAEDPLLITPEAQAEFAAQCAAAGVGPQGWAGKNLGAGAITKTMTDTPVTPPVRRRRQAVPVAESEPRELEPSVEAPADEPTTPSVPDVMTQTGVSHQTRSITDKVNGMVTSGQRQRKEPELAPAFKGIVHSVYTLDDPEGIYKKLIADLELTDALTPTILQGALNRAERNALLAHQLYIVAKADFDRYESEFGPIIESMREAANKELQDEKEKKLRSKAITDADIRGRAYVLFPDEWARVTGILGRAEGMLENLKKMASLWEQRCFSLSTLNNVGRQR